MYIEFLTFKAIAKTGNSIRNNDHIEHRHVEKEVLLTYSILMLNFDLMYKCFFLNVTGQNFIIITIKR